MTPLMCSQVNKPHEDGQLTLYIKGAPERVLEKCSKYLKDGKPEPITDEFKEAYEKAYDVCCSLYLPMHVLIKGHVVYGFKRTPCPCLCSGIAP